MTKKAPPEVLSPSDLAYMSTLNERDRRWFLVTKAADLKAKGKYVLDRNDIESITNKVNAYAKHSGSSNALHITMITSDGLKQNMYYNEIQSEICADELFL